MARRKGAAKALRSRVGRGQRWTAAERARYLREFAESGLSVAAFVRRTGLPPSTFDLWRQQARHGGGRGARRARRAWRAAPQFARVEVLPPAAATGFHLVLRLGGARTAEVTGLDGPTAVAVLEALLRAPSR